MRPAFGWSNLATLMVGFIKRLVVVENDPATGDLLRLIFEEAGFSVAVIRDAEPVPLGTPADLVISDLAFLRGYDSVAAVRGVRALRTSPALPLLVLTAHHAAASDSELAKEATAVMTKPFDVEALLATVANLTESRAGLALGSDGVSFAVTRG
jgi:DNA-binding response OmpR family regulator